MEKINTTQESTTAGHDGDARKQAYVFLLTLTTDSGGPEDLFCLSPVVGGLGAPFIGADW